MKKQLRVERPCTETWDAMKEEGRGRRCVSCDRVVIDIRGMTRREAEARVRAIQRAEGSACAKAKADPYTGEIVFAPPHVGPGARLARGALVAAALVAGCGPAQSSARPQEPAARLLPLASPKPEGPPAIATPPDAGALRDAGTPTTQDAGDGGMAAHGHAHRNPRHGHAHRQIIYSDEPLGGLSDL